MDPRDADNKTTQTIITANHAAHELIKNEKDFINRLYQLAACAPAYSDDKSSELYQSLRTMTEYAVALKVKYPDGVDWIVERNDEESPYKFDIDIAKMQAYMFEVQPLILLANYVVDKGSSGKNQSIEDKFLKQAKVRQEEGSIVARDFPFLARGSTHPYSEISQLLSLPTQRSFRYTLTLNEILKNLPNGDMKDKVTKAILFTSEYANNINERERLRPGLTELVEIANKNIEKIHTESEHNQSSEYRAWVAEVDTKSYFIGSTKEDSIHTIDLFTQFYRDQEKVKGKFVGDLIDACLNLSQQDAGQVLYHALAKKKTPLNMNATSLIETIKMIEDKLKIRSNEMGLLDERKLAHLKDGIFTNCMIRLKTFDKKDQIQVLLAARNDKVFSQPTSQTIAKIPGIGLWLQEKRATTDKTTSLATKEINKKLAELGYKEPSRLSRRSSNRSGSDSE